MKSISLKLNEPVFQEMEKILENVQVSRNKYINEAIEYYNALQDRFLLEKQLLQESATVSEDSMAVLHEFEAIEDEW
jgi:metal-responsive CopG/Arc/MetJ family transcriptional regulator